MKSSAPIDLAASMSVGALGEHSCLTMVTASLNIGISNNDSSVDTLSEFS
jgi:hypothetical protein